MNETTPIFINSHRRSLERFLRSVGGDIAITAECADAPARVKCGDRAIALSGGIVDPVQLRETLQAKDVPLEHFRVVRDAADLSVDEGMRPPFVLRYQHDVRFVQHAADLGLPHAQLMRDAVDGEMILETGGCRAGCWAMGFVEHGQFSLCGMLDVEWLNDFFLIPMRLTLHGSGQETVLSICQRTVDALEILDGPIRIELSVDAEECRVLEVDLGWFSDALPEDIFGLSGMGSYWENQIRMLRGESICDAGSPGRTVVLQWLTSRSGIVEAVEHVDEALAIAGVEIVSIHAEVGMKLGHVLYRGDRDCLGYVVASGESVEDARTAAQEAVDCVRIERKTVL